MDHDNLQDVQGVLRTAEKNLRPTIIDQICIISIIYNIPIFHGVPVFDNQKKSLPGHLFEFYQPYTSHVKIIDEYGKTPIDDGEIPW